MKRIYLLGVLGALTMLTAGCGSKESISTDEPVVESAPPAFSFEAEPADATAPIEQPAPVAFDFASSPRPTNEQGEEASDLFILNDALQQYMDPAARGLDTDVPPPKDLSELVRAGILRNLPAPPPGKKYELDTRRLEVVLVNQ
jgi:hypothetical protein